MQQISMRVFHDICVGIAYCYVTWRWSLLQFPLLIYLIHFTDTEENIYDDFTNEDGDEMITGKLPPE